MKSKVFFTRQITPESVVELYRKLDIALPGKVAVKVHTGEKGNQNYLRPEFWRPMVEEVHGTVVECNTTYGDATEACAITPNPIASCWKSMGGRNISRSI